MNAKRWFAAFGVASILVVAGLSAADATTYGTIQAKFIDVLQKNRGVSYWADTDGDAAYEDVGSTIAGQYHFKTTDCATLNTYAPLGRNTDFGTFCIDLVQTIGYGGIYTYTVMDLADAPSPPGAAMHKILPGQELDLKRLFYGYYDPDKFASDPDEAAAFGLSVWEIVCEHWESGYNVLSGSFLTSCAANDRANTMLWNLPALPSGKTPPELVAFVSTDSQDQMWVLSMGGVPLIPEPLTMLGVFLGLGSVGAYIRRRRMA